MNNITGRLEKEIQAEDGFDAELQKKITDIFQS